MAFSMLIARLTALKITVGANKSPGFMAWSILGGDGAKDEPWPYHIHPIGLIGGGEVGHLVPHCLLIPS
jgi:hypothetical protein